MAIGIRRATGAMPVVERKFLIAGALAAVAAVLVLVVTQPPAKTPILVAGVDLPAGSALGELAMDVRYVESPEGFVIGENVGELADWSLVVPLAEGEPLLPSLLRPPETVTAPNLLALSLEPEHAVLGRLAAGDSVDVYVTSSGAIGEGSTTERLASHVYVVSAALSSEPGQRGGVDILVAVDDDLALLLTSAARSGTIDLVRVGP